MSILPTQKTPPIADLSKLTLLIYGRPKIGKTTLAASFPEAVFLATEPGLNHLEAYEVAVTSWDTFLEACNELASGKHPFKTIVIDTIDNLAKFCSDYICKKYKVEYEGDLGHGKGWALVKAEFHRVLLKLSQLPYGLILISHAKEKEVESRTGSYTKMVTSLPDRFAEIALAIPDMILYLDQESTTDEEGQKAWRRVIRTKPTPYYEAGDRSKCLPDTLDLSYDALIQAYAAGKQATGQVSAPQPPAESAKTSAPELPAKADTKTGAPAKVDTVTAKEIAEQLKAVSKEQVQEFLKAFGIAKVRDLTTDQLDEARGFIANLTTQDEPAAETAAASK